MTKFFKNQKTLFWAHFGPCMPKFGQKMNFPGKKSLCQFLNVPIIYQCAKNQTKLMSHSWQTDRQTDRQTDTMVIL